MSSYDHSQSYNRGHGTGYDAYDEYGQYGDAYQATGYGNDSYARDSYSGGSYSSGSPAADSYARDSYARDSHSAGGYSAGGYSGGGYSAGGYEEPTAGHGSAGRVPAARAAVGSASAGRASVPVAVPDRADADGLDQAARPRYDWSGGNRSGTASPGAAGRASVPVSPGAGPVGATAGRASVRPVGPPGGGPSRPGGAGAGSGPTPQRKKKKKRHWIRNSLLSILAVLVIMTGGGMVALSYYVESVPPPQDMDLEEASTILFNDGSEMAVMQEVNREIIDTKVPELAHVRDAVVAAEDKEFFEHSGVDFLGIMRAAINNLRGGPRQGASTIDQQYAGAAADIRSDASYRRKLEEAAMAYKMNQDHSKLEILDFYLNTIYFGRGAHGVQAAAQAYFGKDAAELSASEAAVLAGTIRLPDDGSGLSPYDPRHNPDDPQIAIDRWNYVLNQMVDIQAITPAERAELTELPEAIKPAAADEPFRGPQGNIVRQVRRELEQMGIEDLYTGGYRVTTTIDSDIQQAALDAARRGNEGPLWEDTPDNIDAAIVAINPENGAVLAYYGGDDGTGFDLAGPNWQSDGSWEGGRPPGSTFKIYTAIAAIREGVSFDSHWKTSEYDPGFGRPIENAGRDARNSGCEGQAPDFCTLRWSMQQSFNVPFFHFAERVPDGQGPSKILQAANDAGVNLITGTSQDSDGNYGSDRRNLAELDISSIGREPFDYHVAFGQYPITVYEHASGVATLAAKGMYHEPHFVKEVQQKVDGEWVSIASDRISGEQRIDPAHANALTEVLTSIPAATVAPTGFSAQLENGRVAAAKTGTWEHPDGGNADAWMVGYTPQIAAAVWVGDEEGKPIKDQFGGNIGSSGLPSQIWKQFMDAAHGAKEYEQLQFPPGTPVGSPEHPLANGEQRQETREPGDPRCLLPFVECPEPDPDEGDEDDNDRGGPGGGNDGGGFVPPPITPPGDENDDQDGQ